MNLEGIVGKRDGSRYSSAGRCLGEAQVWQSARIRHSRLPRAAAGIGSLLLGLHNDDGQLVYAGKVRSGISERTLKALRVAPHRLPRIALSHRPARMERAGVVWLAPQQVCEVKFAEITPAGKVRHAVFVGLRTTSRPTPSAWKTTASWTERTTSSEGFPLVVFVGGQLNTAVHSAWTSEPHDAQAVVTSGADSGSCNWPACPQASQR
jgi:ATP-dependent DNA ligase